MGKQADVVKVYALQLLRSAGFKDENSFILADWKLTSKHHKNQRITSTSDSWINIRKQLTIFIRLHGTSIHQL